mmetsp:Transcript_41786/g.75216  ORF Transcript_41786/g.75216 Transcript_41786/m.75216 type:complete len:122 (+) Transcript_41786:112-477(+)
MYMKLLNGRTLYCDEFGTIILGALQMKLHDGCGYIPTVYDWPTSNTIAHLPHKHNQYTRPPKQRQYSICSKSHSLKNSEPTPFSILHIILFLKISLPLFIFLPSFVPLDFQFHFFILLHLV